MKWLQEAKREGRLQKHMVTFEKFLPWVKESYMNSKGLFVISSTFWNSRKGSGSASSDSEDSDSSTAKTSYSKHDTYESNYLLFKE